jgi:hypothetical protein
LPSVHLEPVDEFYPIIASLDGYSPIYYERFMQAPVMIVFSDYEFKISEAKKREAEAKKNKHRRR